MHLQTLMGSMSPSTPQLGARLEMTWPTW
jgi:hypothetical protein